MLTRIVARNFKRFDDVEIGLSASVVFIGPNNSGKTTALQALALWDAGCKQWLAKRQSSGDAAKAVTIGRKDLVFLPLPSSNALWRDLRVREAYREDGKTKPRNVLIEIVVHGLDDEGEWSCGFEFEYASEEFFYCRPLRMPSGDAKKLSRMPVPSKAVQAVELAFLPPMTGLLMRSRYFSQDASMFCLEVAAVERRYAIFATQCSSGKMVAGRRLLPQSKSFLVWACGSPYSLAKRERLRWSTRSLDRAPFFR